MILFSMRFNLCNESMCLLLPYSVLSWYAEFLLRRCVLCTQTTRHTQIRCMGSSVWRSTRQCIRAKICLPHSFAYKTATYSVFNAHIDGFFNVFPIDGGIFVYSVYVYAVFHAVLCAHTCASTKIYPLCLRRIGTSVAVAIAIASQSHLPFFMCSVHFRCTNND